MDENSSEVFTVNNGHMELKKKNIPYWLTSLSQEELECCNKLTMRLNLYPLLLQLIQV